MRRNLLVIGLFLMTMPLLMAQEELYKIRKQVRISSGANELAIVPFGERYVYTTENTSVGAAAATDHLGRKFFTMFEFSPGSGRKAVFEGSFVTLMHEGIPSFTEDQQTIVFCQMDPDAPIKGMIPIKLYFSKNLNGQWSKPEPFEYNDDLFRLYSPALTPGGDTLFFAADFIDSKGKFDLYYSVRQGGSWSVPVNMGSGVNTPENELYPSVGPMGQLFFSSEGHDGGKDGYDLFETRLMDGEWKTALRLPENQNSSGNDYHIWYASDMRSGYITTDRRSGSKDIWTLEALYPEFTEEPKAIKKTYYKYRIYDRKLDTVDHNLFRYSWIINDTLEIPGHDIIYRFPGPGIYVCKLNVFDIQLDTLVEGQTVKTLPIRLKVQAVINCPDTVKVNTPVTFDGSDTYLPEVDPKSRLYFWEFGDGYLGTGVSVEHSFGFAGEHTVVLNVDEVEKRGSRAEPKRYSNFKKIVVVE